MAAPELADVKAERALVGSVVIDPPAWRRVQHVPPEAFKSWKRKTVWLALSRLQRASVPVDYVTLCDQIEKADQLDDMGGGRYVSGLFSAVPSSLHVESYAEIVLDHYRRREDVRLAEKLAALAMNGGGSPAERAEIAHQILSSGPGERGVVEAWEAASATMEELDRHMADPLKRGEIRDMSTGLLDMDRVTGGLHQGLYTVAGPTSAGKTALALALAVNVARRGKRVVFVSPEMTPTDLMHRVVCAYADVDSRDWERGDLPSKTLEKAYDVLGWASEMDLMITQEGSIAAIEAAVHRAVPVDFVVLDGLERLSGASADRMHVAKGELTSWAKDLADHPDVMCPVWLSLQVSLKQLRNRKKKRPEPGDVYGSGEPEFITDNHLTVFRPDYWEPDSEKHSHLIEVAYWKCRKKRRALPGFCDLYLSPYSGVKDVDVHAEEPLGFDDSRWMD